MSDTKRAIALGFFDGIHIGHAALLRRLEDVSRENGLTSTVISFDELPQNIVGGSKIPLINTADERIWLILQNFKICEITLLHFDEKLASMPWNIYLNLLVKQYNAVYLIVGSNFRFGKDAAGSSDTLLQYCKDSDIGCDIIQDVMIDDTVSSSTYIRELLLEGNIKRANEFLGHRHIFTGVVQKGKKLGTKIGIPTINMSFAPGVVVPAHGVYATGIYIEDTADTARLTGVTNIGVRPTVDDTGAVTAETHIFGFNGDLYDRKVRIEFYDYLRPEMKFGNLDDLKNQIAKDCEAAMKYFAKTY